MRETEIDRPLLTGMEVKNCPGVYMIYCHAYNPPKKYIGSTENILQRLARWERLLSGKLQAHYQTQQSIKSDYQTHGPGSFTFEVVAHTKTSEIAKNIEYSLQHAYNSSSSDEYYNMRNARKKTSNNRN